MADQIRLGDYILERLAQLKLRSCLGVPGDFNMTFLDLIEDHPTLQWVGNANELNAAYSADGYARIKGSIAAVVTTFGVGELSALNGIAGSFAERLPVVHIVGVPSTASQGKHALLHHTLGDGRFEAFTEMSKQISAAMVKLGDLRPEDAPTEIDRVLSICVKEARPVYLSIPTDRVHAKVSSVRLKTPLDLSPPENDAEQEQYVLNEIVSRVRAAKDPIILVDACCIRHGVVAETHELVESSGLPVFSSPMGKTAVSEEHRQYGGIYVGSITEQSILDRVTSADCVISIGALLSDFNTGSFSYSTPRSNTLWLHSDRIQIGWAHYPNVGMKLLLPKISAALASDRESRLKHTLESIRNPLNKLPSLEEEGDVAKEHPEIISQTYLWPRLGQFFRSKDQIIVETGTSSFGMLQARLPAGSIFVSQVLWGSIGWSVGAALGVALAAREEGLGRTCLFIGDGSLQLSAQEIGTMIRCGLTPILFILSNDGYGIERAIHGPERSYNNVSTWNHSLLLDAFSAPPRSHRNVFNESSEGTPPSHEKDPVPSQKSYYAVRTKQELDTLLNDQDFAKADRIQVVEIFMNKDDVPAALKKQAQATSEINDPDK